MQCPVLTQSEDILLEEDLTLKFGKTEVKINAGHLITSIKQNSTFHSIPTTLWSYPSENATQTFSGLYIFNPLEEPSQVPLRLKHRRLQKGPLTLTLDSLYESDFLLFSYRIQLSDQGVQTVSKIKLQNYFEIVLRTVTDSDFSLYVDNSMSL